MSDVMAELDAARSAGVQTALAARSDTHADGRDAPPGAHLRSAGLERFRPRLAGVAFGCAAALAGPPVPGEEPLVRAASSRPRHERRASAPLPSGRTRISSSTAGPSSSTGRSTGHTAFRVDAGDQPEFALYLPGRGGNLRLGIKTPTRAKWLSEAERHDHALPPRLDGLRDPRSAARAARCSTSRPWPCIAEGLVVRVERRGTTARWS